MNQTPDRGGLMSVQFEAQDGPHPKSFVLRAEEDAINRIKEILKEVEAGPGDALHHLFHDRPVEDFKAGVVVPPEHAVDLAEITDADIPEIGDAVAGERQAALEELQEEQQEPEQAPAAEQPAADAQTAGTTAAAQTEQTPDPQPVDGPQVH